MCKDERGVAMVTVLFVAAVMTVVTSTAAFMTIRDFQSGADDRRGAQALAYSEAGVDRMLLLVRSTWTWGELAMSGCGTNPVVSIDGAIEGTAGTYQTEIRPLACSATTPSPRTPQRFAILSTGEHPAARRVVRQVVQLAPRGLPVGLFADSSVVVGGAGGGVRVQNASLVTNGFIEARDQLEFAGMDPYYSRSDFYPDTFPPEPAGSMPSSAHAALSITCAAAQPCGPDKTEHTADDAGNRTNTTDYDINCTANDGNNPSQAAWDGSGGGGPVTIPPSGTCGNLGPTEHAPTSFFDAAAFETQVTPEPTLSSEDLASLEQTAKASGLYCSYDASGNGACTKRMTDGSLVSFNAPSVWDENDLFGLRNNYTAFFDFPAGDPKDDRNTVKWNADVVGCNSDPSLTRSITMVMPNGSLELQSGAVVTGAVFAEAGFVRTAGGATVHGTVITDELDIRGGSNFLVDECWLDNMPAVFLDVTPLEWSEIDR